METHRLYYENPFLWEFDAEVVEKREHEGRPAVVLDRTAFYPESGGQPWDKGRLGGVEVLKVLDLEGEVLHVLESDIPAGPVRGLVDGETRFDHMQQHTGQHVLSQAFYERLRGETLSFHLGTDVSTLEIGLPSIADEQCDAVEDRANGIVWEDRQVKTYFVPEERIGEVPLRRPPKKQGLLRVVEVDGFDYSACGGTHCRRTGEIGLIKLVGLEKIRGRLRFAFLCGGRALRDYRGKDRTARSLAGSLSCPPAEIAAHVEKLGAEFKSMKKRARKLEERAAACEAGEIIRGAGGPVVAGLLADRTPDEARFLALGIVRSGRFAVAYGAPAESQGHIIVARSDDLALDLRNIVPAVGTVLPVKGGGGPSLVELVTTEKTKLGQGVDAAAAWLRANVPGEPTRAPR